MLFKKKDDDMSKDEINAFLGAGTTYHGRLQFKGTVRVDGEFYGEVDSEGTLVVGKEAKVEGRLSVGVLILSGNFQGEVIASGKVVLHRTGIMSGNISTPVLVMEEGAVFEGGVSMGRGGTASGNMPPMAEIAG